MKWGMNLTATGMEHDSKFLKACRDANITDIKVRVTGDVDLTDYFKFFEDNDMKGYFSLFDFADVHERTPSNEYLKTVFERYHFYCEKMPEEVCLGISLPENVHLIKRSHHKAKAGLRINTINLFLTQLITLIHKYGFQAILPARIDDIQGDVWNGVEPDRYDVETMFSHQLALQMQSETFQKILADKKVWLGKVGQLGGYVMPTHQVKFLQRVKEYTKGTAEYAFLWSQKAVERFSWSVGGEFVIDMMQNEIKALNYKKQIPTGSNK